MKQKAKILIVEDDALAAISLQDILEKRGYQVCELVASGEEAIKSTDKEQPDVVLMDIRLVGEMDGIEASREIRSFSEAAIIFVTGYQDKDVRERAEKLKPAAYLLKPINIYKLESIIDSTSSEIQLTDGIQKLIETGQKVIAVKLNENEFWIDIGEPKAYWEALYLSHEHFQRNRL